MSTYTGDVSKGTPSRLRLRRSAAYYGEAYALLGLTLLLIVFFSVWSKTADTFASVENFQVIGADASVVAIVALAAVVPLAADEWDLSIAAITGVAAVFIASWLSAGVAVPLAILLGVALGGALGCANALIVTRLRVNAVIATLGTGTILLGVINQKTQGLVIAKNMPASVIEFGSGTWLGIPKPMFALAFAALGAYYLLSHTPFGRYLYALGNNPEAGRLVGIRTRFVIGCAFVASGALAGIAGAVQVARSGSADPSVGVSLLLPALSAAFLSAASVKPGTYNVGGTLVAVFFLAVLNGGLNLAGAAPYVSNYVNGAALISGIALASYLRHRRTS